MYESFINKLWLIKVNWRHWCYFYWLTRAKKYFTIHFHVCSIYPPKKKNYSRSRLCLGCLHSWFNFWLVKLFMNLFDFLMNNVWPIDRVLKIDYLVAVTNNDEFFCLQYIKSNFNYGQDTISLEKLFLALHLIWQQ